MSLQTPEEIQTLQWKLCLMAKRVLATSRMPSGRTWSESRVREGAADKAAIQLVEVQPCQLPMSDM
jgi:hypothetical protein